MDAVFIGDGLDHEVGGVADIGVGPHEDRAAGDGGQHIGGHHPQGGGQAGGGPLGAGGGEEHQIGGGVVQEAGQGAGGPEHLGGVGQPQLAAHGGQDHQGGLHGDEDAHEQDGHLPDGPPGEVVGLPHGHRRGLEGQQSGQQDDRNLEDGGQGEGDLAEDGQPQHVPGLVLEHGPGGEDAAEDHGGHDHHQEDQIVEPADADLGARLPDVRHVAAGDVLAIGPHINPVKHRQQDHRVEGQHREQAQAPEEGDAPGKAHEQRRVPNGGETAPHVGDEEDEEHHDVAAVPPPGVHFDHRADHEHAGPGGADAAGQHGAQEQEQHVDPGGARQVALQGDVAGHAEQAEQQDDEGEIVADETVQRRLHGGSQPAHQAEGDQKGRRPEGNDPGLVGLPPGGAQQRAQGHAQQQPREGQAQPQGQLRRQAGGGPVRDPQGQQPQEERGGQSIGKLLCQT